MSTIDMNACLVEIEKYIASGELADHFEYSEEDRRYELLDFLEKLMELGEMADEQATKLIFKNSQLQALAGLNNQK